MNISLPTGRVISMSSYDFYFLLKDEDVEEFYQSCVADNLGIELNNPFSNISLSGHLLIEEDKEESEDSK